MRKLFNLPLKQPIFEGDPGRPPETREFDIASTSTAPEALDSTAANLTGVSSMALTRAGVEISDLNANARRQPEQQQGAHEPTETGDLVKHILGDQRLCTMMRQRRLHRPRLRRATT